MHAYRFSSSFFSLYLHERLQCDTQNAISLRSFFSSQHILTHIQLNALNIRIVKYIYISFKFSGMGFRVYVMHSHFSSFASYDAVFYVCMFFREKEKRNSFISFIILMLDANSCTVTSMAVTTTTTTTKDEDNFPSFELPSFKTNVFLLDHP